MLSLAHIGLAGSFGALLVGWSVVVARVLYIARLYHRLKAGEHKVFILCSLDFPFKNTLLRASQLKPYPVVRVKMAQLQYISV